MLSLFVKTIKMSYNFFCIMWTWRCAHSTAFCFALILLICTENARTFIVIVLLLEESKISPTLQHNMSTPDIVNYRLTAITGCKYVYSRYINNSASAASLFRKLSLQIALISLLCHFRPRCCDWNWGDGETAVVSVLNEVTDALLLLWVWE